MRYYKFVSVFVITFLIGCTLTLSQRVVHPQVEVPPVPETAVTPPTSQPEIFEESEDWENERDEDFAIGLIETGEGFHGDQIAAKSGEVWLGLFGKENSYSLRSTTIKVRRVFDGVVDDEKTGQQTGKSVFADGSIEPVFLIKNAKQMIEGPITTLYRAPSDDEDIQPSDEQYSSIRAGFRKEFKISHDTYTMAACKGSTKAGKAILVLVLENDGISQVIHTVPDFEENYLGSLKWAGDLDRDGKPDFYFELYVHDNVSYRNLFLTSAAKKGKLIKKVAKFWTNGC